jgi:hypothetical protein
MKEKARNGRPVPGRVLQTLFGGVLFVFADLVADQAADRGAADRTDRAAARKNRTRNGTGSGAYRGVLVTGRHLRATT